MRNEDFKFTNTSFGMRDIHELFSIWARMVFECLITNQKPVKRRNTPVTSKKQPAFRSKITRQVCRRSMHGMLIEN